MALPCPLTKRRNSNEISKSVPDLVRLSEASRNAPVGTERYSFSKIAPKKSDGVGRGSTTAKIDEKDSQDPPRKIVAFLTDFDEKLSEFHDFFSKILMNMKSLQLLPKFVQICPL